MDRYRTLLFVAAATIALSAIIHLAMGLGGLVEWMTGGSPSVLFPLFLLSGTGILVGMVAVWYGWLALRPAYVLGGIMMLVYLVGYVDWHAVNVTESVLGLQDVGHDHSHDHDHGHDHHDEGGTLSVLYDHLVDDPLALVSKSLETVGLVSVVTLLGITTDEQV